MRATAQYTGTEPLNDEAVWSICAYLAEPRRLKTSLTIQRTDATWAIVSMDLPVQVETKSGGVREVALILVVDLSSDRVLAFKILNSSNRQELANLALYDALASGRRPTAEDRAGLAWTFPKGLLIDPSYRSMWIEMACADLPVDAMYVPSVDACRQSNVVREVQRLWSTAGVGLRQVMSLTKFELVFDRLLSTIQQMEPRRAAQLNSESFSHLSGFSQDPASMLSALRWLLPVAEVQIDGGGILHDGLHYTHELLELWPGRSAQLRVSAEAEARAWVYFDNQVVCPAFAAELRRKDGSLRPNR